ncbi:MAG TPA: hypothetical protein VGO47_13555 [Chlamydiales bacterium]|nr:hypothetical protein [Chlamydiales bacterium]
MSNSWSIRRLVSHPVPRSLPRIATPSASKAPSTAPTMTIGVPITTPAIMGMAPPMATLCTIANNDPAGTIGPYKACMAAAMLPGILGQSLFVAMNKKQTRLPATTPRWWQ